MAFKGLGFKVAINIFNLIFDDLDLKYIYLEIASQMIII